MRNAEIVMRRCMNGRRQVADSPTSAIHRDSRVARL
jgi:hypothetical protein